MQNKGLLCLFDKGAQQILFGVNFTISCRPVPVLRCKHTGRPAGIIIVPLHLSCFHQAESIRQQSGPKSLGIMPQWTDSTEVKRRRLQGTEPTPTPALTLPRSSPRPREEVPPPWRAGAAAPVHPAGHGDQLAVRPIGAPPDWNVSKREDWNRKVTTVTTVVEESMRRAASASGSSGQSNSPTVPDKEWQTSQTSSHDSTGKEWQASSDGKEWQASSHPDWKSSRQSDGKWHCTSAWSDKDSDHWESGSPWSENWQQPEWENKEAADKRWQPQHWQQERDPRFAPPAPPPDFEETPEPQQEEKISRSSEAVSMVAGVPFGPDGPPLAAHAVPVPEPATPARPPAWDQQKNALQKILTAESVQIDNKIPKEEEDENNNSETMIDCHNIKNSQYDDCGEMAVTIGRATCRSPKNGRYKPFCALCAQKKVEEGSYTLLSEEELLDEKSTNNRKYNTKILWQLQLFISMVEDDAARATPKRAASGSSSGGKGKGDDQAKEEAKASKKPEDRFRLVKLPKAEMVAAAPPYSKANPVGPRTETKHEEAAACLVLS